MVTLARARQEVLFRELDGEAVLLEVSSGRYFGLDEVATRIWCLLREHDSVDRIVDRLLEEYEVDEARLRRDVDEFVEQLVAQRLLERVERPLAEQAL